jgi:glycosyltransferase involved in cell wall biosynthesis
LIQPLGGALKPYKGEWPKAYYHWKGLARQGRTLDIECLVATHEIHMRVLQIVADGNPGGGTTHVLQILRDFRSTHSLGLITQSQSYLFHQAKELDIPSYGLHFFPSRVNLSVSFRLNGIYSEWKADLIHVHGGRAGFFHTITWTAVPTVYTVHGCHFIHKPIGIRWLATAIERVIMSRADRIIFVSEHDAKIARACKILPENKPTTIIHNGIQLRKIPEEHTTLAKHVGFVGRLEYPKDPFLFLDALELLPDYTATIVGGGSLESAVKNEITHRDLAKRVRQLGSLSHQESLQILSTFDVLLLTSRWEGLPLVVLEAMCAGVPVVAVNVGGLSEIINHKKNGMLIDERSGQALAWAIRAAVENHELRTEMINQARQDVHNRFSEENMLSEIRKIYAAMA